MRTQTLILNVTHPFRERFSFIVHEMLHNAVQHCQLNLDSCVSCGHKEAEVRVTGTLEQLLPVMIFFSKNLGKNGYSFAKVQLLEVPQVPPTLMMGFMRLYV